MKAEAAAAATGFSPGAEGGRESMRTYSVRERGGRRPGLERVDDARSHARTHRKETVGRSCCRRRRRRRRRHSVPGQFHPSPSPCVAVGQKRLVFNVTNAAAAAAPAQPTRRPHPPLRQTAPLPIMTPLSTLRVRPLPPPPMPYATRASHPLTSCGGVQLSKEEKEGTTMEKMKPS